jgi:hypothetical protein
MTEPVDRLRRILAALDAGGAIAPDDAAWLASGARAYLQDAPAVRLDAALGLHPEWGSPGWWTTGPRAQRDAALIEMHKQLFGHLDIASAARAIVALARRWHERGHLHASEARLLDRLNGTCKGVPGARQVANILRTSRDAVVNPPRKSDAVSNFLT